jgi:hypothetical protein
MGKAKGKGSACLDYEKEGWNYCSGKKEAFAAYESTLGGEEKSKPEEISIVIERVSGWLEPWLGASFGLSRRSVQAIPLF